MSPHAHLVWPDLQAYLSELGFERLDGRRHFVRESTHGGNYILLNFNYDRAVDELFITYGVEHKRCHDFFVDLFPNQSNADVPLIVFQSFYFNLADSPELLLNELKSLMADKGFTFFEQYGNEHILESEINLNPLQSFPNISRPLKRITYGLYLAKRFQNPAFSELVSA